MTNSDLGDAGEGKVEETPAAVVGPVATDQVILATAGYDHAIKFWAAHTGVCTRTLQHDDSQVGRAMAHGGGSSQGFVIRELCDQVNNLVMFLRNCVTRSTAWSCYQGTV